MSALCSSLSSTFIATDLLQAPLHDPLGADTQDQTAALRPSLSPERPQGSPLLPPSSQSKDLSFLYEDAIYHPLPPPLHQHLVSSPPENASIAILPSLLSCHNYRAAAEFCANRLTKTPKPSQRETFSLFYTRLASLVLLKYTALAAQESKALEDISSPFYRFGARDVAGTPIDEDGGAGGSILPWELQVLWARLTGLANGDVRRSISVYYELARNARRAYKARGNNLQDKEVWRQRLQELGLGVASVMVEAGDLEGAARHLEGMRSSRGSKSANRREDVSSDDSSSQMHDFDALVTSRTALVYLALGDIEAATRCIEPVASFPSHPTTALLPSLIQVAQSSYEEAITSLRSLLSSSSPSSSSSSPSSPDKALIIQNLAICLFYTGRIEEAISLLEDLIDPPPPTTDADTILSNDSEDHAESSTDKDTDTDITQRPRSFHALTFNLATCFELTSERSAARKMELADKVVTKMRERGGNQGERNPGVDFKL